MPLGAARLTLLAKSSVTAVAEVIRKPKSISAQGNVSVVTTDSKYAGSSAYFDGAADYLDLSGQAIALEGDWTFETWINSDVIGSSDVILRIQTTADAFIGSLYLTNGKIATYIGGGGTTGTTVMSADTWYHLAWCRDNGIVRMYINGVQDVTRSYAVDQSATNLYIGHFPGDANTRFNGWMEDMRLSNTARYPDGTSFTPPTASLINDDNTVFLIHGHGTSGSTFFEDDNGVGRSAVGLIADDNAQVDTAQSQFGGTSAEFPSTYGWLQTGAVDAFAVSGDWTKEFWIYYNKSDVDQYIHHNRGGYASGSFYIYTPSSGNVRVRLNDGGTTRDINTTFSTGQWYHYALVNNSGTITWYVNGSSVGTASWSSTINNPDKTLRWGGFSAGGSTDKFEGWIDEYRFSDTARYTSGFTPSTTPFVNDTNTLLLLHMDGTDGSTTFRDDNGTGRSAVGISAYGNAQLDTAQSQFGGSSLLLDGTGDYLRADGAFTTLTSNTDSWTLEAWVYESVQSTGTFWFGVNRIATGGNVFLMGSAAMYMDGTNSAHTQASSSTWNHWAACHDNSTGDTKLYLNGTLHNTISADHPDYAFNECVFGIGAEFDSANGGAPGNYLNGYMDEVRVSNTVRYTGTFTPSTEPFQNDDNTLLLLHMDGTDGSTTFIDDNGVTTAGTGA